MNNKNVSVDQTRAERIITLMPELDSRYRKLRNLLERSCDGEACAEAALWLAQGDLTSVINAMTGSGFIDEDED
jgi:hypothetical protein